MFPDLLNIQREKEPVLGQKNGQRLHQRALPQNWTAQQGTKPVASGYTVFGIFTYVCSYLQNHSCTQFCYVNQKTYQSAIAGPYLSSRQSKRGNTNQPPVCTLQAPSWSLKKRMHEKIGLWVQSLVNTQLKPCIKDYNRRPDIPKNDRCLLSFGPPPSEGNPPGSSGSKASWRRSWTPAWSTTINDHLRKTGLEAEKLTDLSWTIS